MKTEVAITTRAGIVALLLAGVLFTITLLLRGPAIIDPSGAPVEFARTVTSPGYVGWGVGTIVANALHLLGALALFQLVLDSAPRAGFWAMILSVLHDALFAPFVGFSLALPAIGNLVLQGNEAAVQAATFSGPVLVTLMLAGVLGAIGSILFGIAIWRTDTLPNWIAVTFTLALPLLAFAPTVSFVAELVGALLLVVAGAGLLAAVWRSRESKAVLVTGEPVANRQ